MSQVDVSVVLNMHREALYLRPTLYSLDACAAEAAKNGINVELIAVFDRPDLDTVTVFQSTPLAGFAEVKTVEIDVGSLGLARNAGIDLAEGTYVWTADGDDLVSRNAIVRLTQTALEHPHKDIAIFMEYLAAFGDQYHVAHYVGSEWLTAADFAFQHPYVSRIFVRRTAFEQLRYHDLKVTTGFAYEDWDFNCRLLAAGFTFMVAPDTVFFYRQRGNSLLRQANSLSARLIPHSILFDPECFCVQMTRARDQHPNWSDFLQERRNFHKRTFAQELLASEKLAGYITEAAALDPEVEPQLIASAHSCCPIPWDGAHWGFFLDRFYALVGKGSFTDVVLVPWLKPGGAEKYILQILEQLQSSGIARRILVLAGERASKHEWVPLLPKGTVFVDLFNTFPSLDDAGRTALAVRAMLAVTEKGGRLHLKASPFAHRVMETFGAALSTHLDAVYYRFSDSSYIWRKHRLFGPWGVKFLRQQAKNIHQLISDCHSIIDNDANVIAASTSKHNVIYARCDTKQQEWSDVRTPRKRLLWASRVSSEKRPELVRLLAAALRYYFPDLIIDVYGQIESPYKKSLFDVPGVDYRGAFSHFADLHVDRYDAFVYTSGFDGLPNVILEAMGAGLTVIAPDVGGISEAVVDGETGFLIPDLVDEAALVAAYMQAVRELYGDWDRTQVMRRHGQRLIKERHGQEAFSQRVVQVFGTGSEGIRR